jgi:hypothetical protein
MLRVWLKNCGEMRRIRENQVFAKTKYRTVALHLLKLSALSNPRPSQVRKRVGRESKTKTDFR